MPVVDLRDWDELHTYPGGPPHQSGQAPLPLLVDEKSVTSQSEVFIVVRRFIDLKGTAKSRLLGSRIRS